MKKVFTLLALCLLSLVGSVQAMAELWVIDGEGDYPAVDKIETGVWYAVASPRNVAGLYLGTQGMVSTLDNNALWQFETVGKDTDGYTIYVLKQKSSGKYLMKGFEYTENKDKAFMFTAEHSQYNEAPRDQLVWEGWDVRFSTTAGEGDNGSYVLIEELRGLDFVFCESPANQNGPTYLNCYGAFSGYRDTNNWAVYKVKHASANQTLTMWFDNFGSFDYESYETGEDPGQYGEAELQAAIDAWNALNDLYNEGTEDVDAANAAIQRFEEAYQALMNSVRAFGYGYYVFTNWRDASAMCGADDKRTLWTSNYTVPEALEDWTFDDLRYVWEYLSKDGKNYLRNCATNTYLGLANGRSQVIPLTDEPTAAYNVLVNEKNEQGLTGWFNIIPEERPNDALHTQVSGQVVVYWTTDAPASLWQLHVVSSEVLDTWTAQLEQERLNGSLRELYSEASREYAKAYTQYYASDATYDGEFPNSSSDPETYVPDGILTDESQITSNAQQVGEGSILALVDGVTTSYFHSSWSATITDEEGNPVIHNLELDLLDSYDKLVFKYAKRSPENISRRPLSMHVYATNDPEGEWTDAGRMSWSYDYSCVYGGSTVAEAVGVAALELSEPYRYLRLDMDDNNSGSVYFTIGELRVYPASLDKTQGVLSQMDAAVVSAFQDALAEAKIALEDGLATQAIIDRLNAAYDAFMEAYPDPKSLQRLLDEAQSWVVSCPTGSEPGCYPDSAVEALQKAIESVHVYELMTMDEINAGKKILNDALTAFQNAFILPQAGSYMIVSQTTGLAAGNRMYVRRPGGSPLGWGGYSEEDGLDEDVTNLRRAEYLWQLVDNGNRTFLLRNYGTGAYLATPVTVEPSAHLAMTTNKAKALAFSLRSARCTDTPAFNLIVAEDMFLNFQPGGKAIVMWGGAEGHDNSAFLFEEIEESDWSDQHRTLIDYEVGVPRVVTFPYDVTPSTNRAKGSVYNLLGQDAKGDYHFAKYTEGTITAGTPFLFYSDNEEYRTCPFTIGEDGVELSTIAYTVGNFFNNNGLVGVLEDVMLPAGCGYIDAQKYQTLHHLIATEEGDVIAAGTGYFTKCAQTTQEGDLVITGSASITTDYESSTGISQVVVNKPAVRGTYNLMGQKVSGKLPAGLYIMGGRKVLVK